MPKTTDDLVREMMVEYDLDYEDAMELVQDFIIQEILFNQEEEFDWADIIENRALELPDIEEEEFERIFKIGCKFDGINEIMEYEDNDIYIPSSYYCAIKCFEKYLDIEFDKIGLNPYGDSLRKIRNYLHDRNKIDLDCCPSIFKKKGEKFVTIDKSSKNKVGACILLIRIKKCFYHAVLIKSDKITMDTFNKIIQNIKTEKNKKLSEDSVKLQLPKIKHIDPNFYVYDIETSSRIVEKIKIIKDEGIQKQLIEEKRYQVPEGLGFMKIKKENHCNKKDVITCIGNDCYEQMMDYISENDEEEEIKIFAHNGGRFDNIFVKGVNGVIIKEQIKTGGCIRKIKIEYNKKTFIFLDSCSFLQASLKKCCEFFNTENKDDFDIVNKSHEWFIENKDWIKYMKQDVYVLGLIMEKFENYLNQLGESITTSIGIASVAWRIMSKSCFGLSKMFIAKDPITQEFIKESCYGGRILHYMKKFIANETLVNGKKSKGLISLDGNSLYPSAMFIGIFPIGKHKLLPKNISIEDFYNNFLKKGFLCITEVEINSNNSRYPLIPYRTEKRNLIYRSGKFYGVYNSIDLLEAINDGMEILKVIRGIYWVQSGRIFHDLIENFYKKRAQFKKEGNGMEYVLKIALNSMFGKFLEAIDSCYKYNEKNIKATDDIRKIVLLSNGQKEYDIKFDHDLIKKPSQIASFILSYARKIMNNIIRKIGPENIFYSDTDSVYCPIESIKDIQTNPDLCGFKNDYGEGTLITKAYFIDLKRYYLEFNKPVEKSYFKAKFNGLNFKDKKALKNWFSKDDDSTKSATIKLYEWFYQNPNKLSNISIIQERWTRLHDSIYISDKEMKYQINPGLRNEWINDIAYPLFFNHKKERTLLGLETSFEIGKKIDYFISKFGLKSALPLVCDKISKNYVSIQQKVLNEEFQSSYIVDKNNIYYLRKFDKNGNEEFYQINEYGPINKINKKPKEITQLVVIKNFDNIYPKINKEELNKIYSSIAFLANHHKKEK
jgi:DNA polymerase type B, organellar and viral